MSIPFHFSIRLSAQIPGESEMFARLVGYGIKSMRPIFKTEMLIYQSKINLHEKILFRKIPHLIDPEMRKILEKGMFGSKIPHSILVHYLPPIEIRITFLKLAMQTSMLHKSWTRMERGILDSHTDPLQALFLISGSKALFI